MNKIDYYMSELAIAMDKTSSAHIQPEFFDTDKTVLDIGGGIGHTLVAAQFFGQLNDAKLHVLDINTDALIYGKRNYNHISFEYGFAESLPFECHTFDCIVSRVTLPLTDISKSLDEIYRTLKPGGHVWLTMHPWSMVYVDIKKAWEKKDINWLVMRLYVAINGLVFNLTGKQFKFMGRNETWQSKSGMLKALIKAKFKPENIKISNNNFFVCEATK